MNSNPGAVGTQIENLVNGLTEHAPDGTFAGKTLAQIKAAVKPSLDARAKVTDLEQQLAAARVERNNADPASVEVVLQVVSSIKGDPNYGENSALYAALGYVRKDDRASGLTRRSTDAEEKAA